MQFTVLNTSYFTHLSYKYTKDFVLCFLLGKNLNNLDFKFYLVTIGGNLGHISIV